MLNAFSRCSFATTTFLVVVLLASTGRMQPAPATTATATAKSEGQKELPLPGQTFLVRERVAFLIPAPSERVPHRDRGLPWVWYAPTLPSLPGAAERWMFARFLAAGVAIAGIDVGESFGNPTGQELYSALYTELTARRGYSSKPVLLGRSRGGLMTLAWAANHPQSVGGFAGIYPVCDLTSYPGLTKAAPAFQLSADALGARLAEFNPVARLAPLARERVPLFAIHGDADKLVPLGPNSLALKTAYEALGGTMTLLVPPGQGHSMWPGFFESEALVAFVLQHAR